MKSKAFFNPKILLVLSGFLLGGVTVWFLTKNSSKPQTPLTQINQEIENQYNTQQEFESEAVPKQDLHTSTSKLSYKLNNFEIEYNKDWTLLQLTDDAFPLKNRLINLSDNVIAFEKKGYYLLILTYKEPTGGSGIFIADSDKVMFYEDKELITTNGKKLYLSKSHSEINTLEQAHTGPAMWASLYEFIEKVQVADGKIYEGYNGYLLDANNNSYNFIKLGPDDETTPSEIQNEIIEMIKSINL